MVLEVIYVVRHGYRSSWAVDPTTGIYSSSVRTPTGIPSDPALASYGVLQAKQLATYLLDLNPSIDLIYSSPYYRCLQTLAPFAEQLAQRHGDKAVRVHLEPGLGEFYGLARFDHPSPASIDVLSDHFPHLHAEKDPVIVPSTKGETIPQLHNRIAYCLAQLIKRADEDPQGPKSVLLCTHAASVISIGRTLTGRMPDDVNEEDFKAFTCGFSKFSRRTGPSNESRPHDDAKWSPQRPDEVPDVGWRNGKGVAGGWDCGSNSDCSFLENGEERGWRFSGDESFMDNPNEFNDAKNTGRGSGARL